jgi:hypothetical protein
MLTLPAADWPFRGHIAPVMLLTSDQPRAGARFTPWEPSVTALARG